ncbi:MAG TPA: glucose-6-phosphate dehydrogenase [Candidatus Saccharimonadales bacterium]|nr:glucose-6-phosphate dehydrogenase [Candidatus Saccharimonadales bacterium]
MGKMSENVGLPPTNLVIFGITGDLASRYILPSLATLDEQGELPDEFRLIGLSRREVSAEEVLDGQAARLASYTTMLQVDMSRPSDYAKITERLMPDAQTIFYLSVPPAAVVPIVRNLSTAGFNKGKTKLLLEKPFGYDLPSAEELVQETRRNFSEEQIFRIDHYMAKAMAQNISVFLGSNALFRNIWNKDSIESIDVISTEKIGIEGRADFYESTGALRDVLQNHLMNLAALTLMRPCSSLFEFEELPKRRLEALEALKPADPARSLRAQYRGYRDEVKNPRSLVETFAAVEIESTDPRWSGVPIRLATGKSLDAKLTEIRVRFKATDASQANELVLRIQPREGVEIDLWAKKPGFGEDLQHLPLSFNYAEGSEGRLPDAYEQVLVDAMRSRDSLFASSDEVIETWRVLQPVLKSWSMSSADLRFYEPGSTIEQVWKIKT